MAIIFLPLFFVASCAHHLPLKENSAPPAAEHSPPQKQAPPSDALGLRYSQKLYDFWIDYFATRDRARFLRHLRNGHRYEAVVKGIFRHHGLPEDLYYVGLIESGYYSKARSKANAVGPFQFIRGTARRYGLRVDAHVDERVNLVKSAHASARYFKDLYNIFANWELALCAYNSGEYRVINAIRKGNTRDYRELAQKKLLPRETIFYVPKVAAARARALQEAQALGPLRPENPFEDFQIQKISHSFSLAKAAKGLGISQKRLRAMNPGPKGPVVRASRKRPFELLAPRGAPKLGREVRARTLAPASPKRRFHRVKKGENLWLIARKYGLTPRKVQRANGLRGHRIYPGQRLVLRPSSLKIYTVRRGDSLFKIAQKFGVGVGQIKRVNNMRKSRIYPGQEIHIPQQGS